MVENLFGSKNMERILLFLFVNNKCYGTGLQKIFQIPLTPIQKALIRLEKAGIILSCFEGKTKLYRFNPSYPLLEELEALLKKAYTFLSPDEKKQYHFINTQKLSNKHLKENSSIILSFWDRLKSIEKLTFTATTNGKEKWERKGYGIIKVQRTDNSLIFDVKGTWSDKTKQIDFTDCFRWALDPIAGMISLEHMRYGRDKSVFLFHLAPSADQHLSSIGSHLCGTDSYFGHLYCDKHYIRLSWRVIGSNKNEEIEYFYT